MKNYVGIGCVRTKRVGMPVNMVDTYKYAKIAMKEAFEDTPLRYWVEYTVDCYPLYPDTRGVVLRVTWQHNGDLFMVEEVFDRYKIESFVIDQTIERFKEVIRCHSGKTILE